MFRIITLAILALIVVVGIWAGRKYFAAKRLQAGVGTPTLNLRAINWQNPTKLPGVLPLNLTNNSGVEFKIEYLNGDFQAADGRVIAQVRETAIPPIKPDGATTTLPIAFTVDLAQTGLSLAMAIADGQKLKDAAQDLVSKGRFVGYMKVEGIPLTLPLEFGEEPQLPAPGARIALAQM